jgi:hypothetical protein
VATKESPAAEAQLVRQHGVYEMLTVRAATTALLAPLALGACAAPRAAPFWRPGAYWVTATVEDTSFWLFDRAGFEKVFGPHQRTVVGAILIDSVAGDSLFGEYLIPFLRMGVKQGFRDSLVGNDQRQVRGVRRGDAFFLTLDPQHVDGELFLDGAVSGVLAAGRWREPPPGPTGTFRLRPATF